MGLRSSSLPPVLDLSHGGLTSVDGKTREHTGLVELDLSSNSLKELGENVGVGDGVFFFFICFFFLEVEVSWNVGSFF